MEFSKTRGEATPPTSDPLLREFQHLPLEFGDIDGDLRGQVDQETKHIAIPTLVNVLKTSIEIGFNNCSAASWLLMGMN